MKKALGINTEDFNETNVVGPERTLAMEHDDPIAAEVRGWRNEGDLKSPLNFYQQEGVGATEQISKARNRSPKPGSPKPDSPDSLDGLRCRHMTLEKRLATVVWHFKFTLPTIGLLVIVSALLTAAFLEP